MAADLPIKYYKEGRRGYNMPKDHWGGGDL